MTRSQFLKNISTPTGRIDVVIDTDACNEVDDQFAISYLLRSTEKLNTVALYAAPYSFPGICDTDEGMERSYAEILKLLELAGEADKPAFRGSARYLSSNTEAVESDAARDLASRAMSYSPEHPLYVVAIGAPTNIASAIIMNPAITENIVIVWLGGHGHELGWTDEFNMRQDLIATRIIMSGKAPFVQIPCQCVSNAFSVSAPELREYLLGKNPLADYLASNVLSAHREDNSCWDRVLWDVVAVGWLLNDSDRFMLTKIMPIRKPDDAFVYVDDPDAPLGAYVNIVFKGALMTDMVKKLGR